MELAIDREGYSVAKWLNQLGIAAFVLKYRLAPTPPDPLQASMRIAERVKESALRLQARAGGGRVIDLLSEEQRNAMFAAREDGLEAVRYVRAHAAQWGLSSNYIGIVGFSAGALTAVDVALKSDATSRPDLVAPIYGALSDTTEVPSSAPPAFIAVAGDDVMVSLSMEMYSAWRANGATAELHVLENGGHGFGMLHQGKRSDQWPELFDHWLAAHGFETRNTAGAH
jgi:acetyl esterase/lipase